MQSKALLPGAVRDAGRIEVRISDWKPFEKNTLKGFLTVTVLPSGISIRDCTYHEKENGRWISFPGRQYEKNGIMTWTNFIEFESGAAKRAFQDAALEALDRLFEQGETDDVPC
jgi:hypothetical protein